MIVIDTVRFFVEAVVISSGLAGVVPNVVLDVRMVAEILIQGRTTDLSLYGCGIVAEKPFAAGTRVRLRITHVGAKFEAIGRVAHTSDTQMGIAFARIESNDQTILEKWVNKLRGVKA